MRNAVKVRPHLSGLLCFIK